MAHKPVAAGKSSFDLIDSEKLFSVLDLKPGATVLDLACGAGRYTIELAAAVGNLGKVYAVDLWQEGLIQLEEEAARNGLKQIETVLSDICKPLPLNSHSVDTCLLATILHDLPAADQAGVIRETARLLKPGGTLNIVEFKKLDHGPGPGIAIRLDEAQVDALVTPQAYVRTTSAELGEFTYLLQYRKNGTP